MTFQDVTSKTDSAEDTSSGISRRRVLATSAAGLAGLGVLGTTGRASAAIDDHTLAISGSKGGDTRYTFTVERGLEKTTANGGSLNDSDRITRQSAHGRVNNGKDVYQFDGDLISFGFYGDPINVYLNGGPAHVGRLPDHLIEIDGTGPAIDYTFSVEGDLKKSTAHGATLNSGDRVFNDGVTASGRVNAGKDAYTYNDSSSFGSVLAYDSSTVENVYIDGQHGYILAEHLLQIQGTGPKATYQFTVSDNLSQISSVGGTINDGDNYGPDIASGFVYTGADNYTFDGTLKTFDLNGKANVLLDGEPAHVGQIPDQ